MKLEEGKTLLQQVQSGSDVYNLYYGNRIYEVKNGIEDRSLEGMSVPQETYEQILETFKQSDEFKQYDEYKETHGGSNTVPSQPTPAPTAPVQQQASQDSAEISATKQQVDALNKQIVALQQQLQTTSSMNAQLQQEVAIAKEEEKKKVAEAEEKAKQAVAQMQQVQSEPAEDDDDEDGYVKPDITGKLQIVSIVATVLTLAFCVFGMSKISGNVKSLIKQATEPTTTDTLTLTIDGESYEITASQIELQNGESSVAVYGLMTTNQNGEKVKKVIPLGEIKVENSSSESTENTDAGTDSTDANTENAENQ